MTPTIDELIAKAQKAQEIIEYWPQEKADEMAVAAGWETYKLADEIARLAVKETGMGLVEHKRVKHQKKTLGVLRDLEGVQTTGVIEEDLARGLIKIAKPVGVIGALTPVTNCEATLPAKALPALKCRNAIIFAPHPKATKTAQLVTESMRSGLEKIGAPVDLIQTIETPSIEKAKDLMSKVDLVIATGGSAMVKSAYSSGTPAYGVGAGNAVVVVDETADLEAAAEMIFLGKTFDNATSCSSENSVILLDMIYEKMLENLKKQGGYLCSVDERARLKEVMWPDGLHLNKDIVAQPVKMLADMAEISIPGDTTFLMVLGEEIGENDPFCKEKLSLVLTVWRSHSFDEAIQMVENITGLNGRGHSCGIHTRNEGRVLKLGTRVKASRIMVNQPHSYGNSGNYNNGMPFTLTLGCGTWGGNITTENIHWKHYLNVTWISKPIQEDIPDDSRLFGAYWEKYGK
ncbi:MAG: aldehyde dehydrogenase family protein [Brevefilum sp.]